MRVYLNDHPQAGLSGDGQEIADPIETVMPAFRLRRAPLDRQADAVETGGLYRPQLADPAFALRRRGRVRRWIPGTDGKEWLARLSCGPRHGRRQQRRDKRDDAGDPHTAILCDGRDPATGSRRGNPSATACAQAASDLHRLTVAASTAPAAIYGNTRVTFESFAFV